jgi:hypothetical protein
MQLLRGCCPCIGSEVVEQAVERFEQAQDKNRHGSETAKETKGLLDTYGLEEDIEEAGEEGANDSTSSFFVRGLPRTPAAAPADPRGPAPARAGSEFEVKGPISSDRIKALLDRQVRCSPTSSQSRPAPRRRAEAASRPAHRSCALAPCAPRRLPSQTRSTTSLMTRTTTMASMSLLRSRTQRK